MSFLDNTGLQYFWGKIRGIIGSGTLNTTNKTIIPATNELNNGLTNMFFKPTGTATTNSAGITQVNTGLNLTGKKVFALANYANTLGDQFTAYIDSVNANGIVGVRFRKISDGAALGNTSVDLSKIVLVIV